MQAKRCVSALRRRQPPASIASCPRRRQFAVARAGQKNDPGLKIAGNLANVGFKINNLRESFFDLWLNSKILPGYKWLSKT